MAFPTSIPSNTNPTASNKLSSPSHSQLHQSHNAEIVAVETKIGTGASTPTSGNVLRATGTGTSAWGQTVLSTDVASATSADLRGVLSDETGTGVAVFGTSPTITTPAVSNPTITAGGSWAGSPTITTPTIASFTNAQHDHSNAAGGGLLTHTAFPLGAVVQVVNSTTSAVATGTTVIPYDDTIPQNTEGDQYLSLAITPKSTTNVLVIEALLWLSNATGTLSHIAALFQDSTANALNAGIGFQLTATAEIPVIVKHVMTAGTTSATTFKVRAGSSGAGTLTLNGQSGARKFGGVHYSSIVITEYKA